MSALSARSPARHVATTGHRASAPHPIADAGSKAASAVAIARQLEQRFILDGWSKGRCYGREDELAAQFGVSRNRVREAARILELRGTARMRRGRMGGLQTSTPPADLVRDMVWGYCRFARLPARPLAAAGRLEPTLPPKLGANRILAFYGYCLEVLDRPGALELSSSTPPALGSTRVGQIVHDLMLRRQAGGWLAGQVLASEAGLCEQYQVDRGVMRQALRVLEAAGVAVSIPGRGHGLMALAATPDSLCQLICCHFSAMQVSLQEIQEAVEWLNEEAASQADRGSRTEPVPQDHYHAAPHPALGLLRRSLGALAAWNMQKSSLAPREMQAYAEPMGLWA
ncbi:GntR family transcriptional regulator [Phenylobacterium montanum]|uniref:GntR family transcriptional regulator n=1 Tax=Phenylobacterium montanum TaxID=2823693 RepID=A0A975G3H7_9CAUL|nr:GntR family transcriptional regulator [Caulobacter sp. S6]QUD90205.1 GntR family transcriptional regulator [Caulobacter sp. S6]